MSFSKNYSEHGGRQREDHTQSQRHHHQAVKPLSQSEFSKRVDYQLVENGDKLTFITPMGIKVLIYQGDITQQATTAIVNAANSDLWLGSGVAGAISKVAGREMQDLCDQYIAAVKHRTVKVGDVACTRSCGQLKCQYVIHAVGPQNRSNVHLSEIQEKLISAIFKSLRCLELEGKLKSNGSISIPAISSGIFGVDIALVSKAFKDAIFKYDNGIEMKKPHLNEIHLVDIDKLTTDALKSYFRKELSHHTQGMGAKPGAGDVRRLSNRESKGVLGMISEKKGNGPVSSQSGKSKEHSSSKSSMITTNKESMCQKESKAHSKTELTKDNVKGNQPRGTKLRTTDRGSLKGYEGYGTIRIQYSFPCGKQIKQHRHPGRGYSGTSLYAYLPDNEEGRDIEKLLNLAFDRDLLFTIGISTMTDKDDSIIQNISLKTQMHGTKYGYPDPLYLKNVREELRSKGIISKEGDKKHQWPTE